MGNPLAGYARRKNLSEVERLRYELAKAEKAPKRDGVGRLQRQRPTLHAATRIRAKVRKNRRGPMSGTEHKKFPNLLNRRFHASKPLTRVVTDITHFTYQKRKYAFIIQSMSRAGTPRDNAVMESVFGWFKEFLRSGYLSTRTDPIEEVLTSAVYDFNHFRPSCKLQYKSPVQFKMEQGF